MRVAPPEVAWLHVRWGLSVGRVKVPSGTWVAQVFVWNFIACAVVEFDVMLILSSDLSLSILEDGWCSE